MPGGRTGTVYAIRSELETWLSSDRNDATGSDIAVVEAEPPIPRQRRFRWNGALVAALVASVLVISLPVLLSLRRSASADAPVSLAAVAFPAANRDTREFARNLNGDLARFANASPDLAVFEREAGTAPETQYVVRTGIERANGKLIANAQVIAVQPGQVIWSRRFEQSGPALSALREQVAANIIGVLRCSFGGLEDERHKAQPGDLEQLMAICQSFEEDDLAGAQARARRLTRAHPDLALGWAMLALIQGDMLGEGNAGLQSQAVANSRRAAAIAPDNVATWLARAAASGEGPTGPPALPIIDAALRRHPDNPSLLNNRSVVLFNLGYVKAAVTDAMNSLRSDPSSFGGRGIAVRRLASAGQIEEALQLQAATERLWPGHPQVISTGLQIITDNARRRAADIATIRKYEREYPANPDVAYMLARLFERTGNRPAARMWLARAPVKNTLQQSSLLFWPDAAGLRTEPAFFRKMADLGLVRRWVARRSWPDFCAEEHLQYDCAREAEKLHIR